MTDASEPREFLFPTVEVVLALHQRQLDRCDEAPGLRDRELPGSAPSGLALHFPPRLLRRRWTVRSGGTPSRSTMATPGPTSAVAALPHAIIRLEEARTKDQRHHGHPCANAFDGEEQAL